jgi:hypothetical protein
MNPQLAQGFLHPQGKTSTSYPQRRHKGTSVPAAGNADTSLGGRSDRGSNKTVRPS